MKTPHSRIVCQTECYPYDHHQWYQRCAERISRKEISKFSAINLIFQNYSNSKFWQVSPSTYINQLFYYRLSCRCQSLWATTWRPVTGLSLSTTTTVNLDRSAVFLYQTFVYFLVFVKFLCCQVLVLILFSVTFICLHCQQPCSTLFQYHSWQTPPPPIPSHFRVTFSRGDLLAD